MSAAEMRASGARQGVRKFIGECGVFAWRAILKMWRTPEQFADVLLQPTLFTAMFGYLLGGGGGGGSVREFLAAWVPGGRGRAGGWARVRGPRRRAASS